MIEKLEINFWAGAKKYQRHRWILLRQKLQSFKRMLWFLLLQCHQLVLSPSTCKRLFKQNSYCVKEVQNSAIISIVQKYVSFSYCFTASDKKDNIQSKWSEVDVGGLRG